MTKAPTPKQLGLARRIADEVCENWEIRSHGQEWSMAKQAALAAIGETSRVAAEMAEKQQAVFGSRQYATGQPASSFGERFACGRIIEQLRSLDHLKESDDD